MFRSGGTATVPDGTIQMSLLALAQAASPSGHGKTAAWRPLLSNGPTAAQSHARSVVAIKRLMEAGHSQIKKSYHADRSALFLSETIAAKVHEVAEHEGRELTRGTRAFIEVYGQPVSHQHTLPL
jgi:hypothetical protein